MAATDWDSIAKKEHLDQLGVEMRKLEGQIREIYAEMLQLQQREQEMRDLNGGAAAGVLCAQGGSAHVCVPSVKPCSACSYVRVGCCWVEVGQVRRRSRL